MRLGGGHSLRLRGGRIVSRPLAGCYLHIQLALKLGRPARPLRQRIAPAMAGGIKPPEPGQHSQHGKRYADLRAPCP